MPELFDMVRASAWGQPLKDQAKPEAEPVKTKPKAKQPQPVEVETKVVSDEQ